MSAKASISVMKDFRFDRNEKFLRTAEKLKPELRSRVVAARKIVEIRPDSCGTGRVVSEKPAEALPTFALKRGERVALDFGEHLVGYLTLELEAKGCHPDAPAYLRLKFGEVPQELLDQSGDYHGWISRSWIQEEFVHVDVLPACLELPRRYAFRYLEIEVIDVSLKYSLRVTGASCRAVTSADMTAVEPLKTDDPLLAELDRVSVRTLRECMQEVFEDGPKRDRRLWLGDLRLQALTNAVTFRNFTLVKRCLYLFAGMPINGGRLAACVFTEPEPEPDDSYLMDYALLFGSLLLDYYRASGDREALTELYPTAVRQIEICVNELDEHHLTADPGDEFTCFIDWGDALNKQCSAQGVLLYSMRCGMRLAEELGDKKTAAWLQKEYALCREAAITHFWDERQGLFVSGEERQISWASQVWMALAEVFDRETTRKLLRRTMAVDPPVRMTTPYMMHYFIDALFLCGESAPALDELKRYWGGMLREGADTFWEVYDPRSENESPYGSSIVNSYCHAWSCTPSYFLRRPDNPC